MEDLEIVEPRMNFRMADILELTQLNRFYRWLGYIMNESIVTILKGGA